RLGREPGFERLQRLHADLPGVVVLRVRTVDRVAQHDDELGLREELANSLQSVRMEEVVRRGLAGDKLAAVAAANESRASYGREVPAVPRCSPRVVEAEVLDLFVRRPADQRMPGEVLVERARTALLRADDHVARQQAQPTRELPEQVDSAADTGAHAQR